MDAATDKRDPASLRQAIRAGQHGGHTAGCAPGYVQANICILPKDYADEFLLYCMRNPQPCPLLAQSDPGDPALPELAADIDIRTDLPRYHVFRDGSLVEETTDIQAIWRDDFVTFAMGCSFSFEEALLDAGLPLRFLERGEVAAVYETDIDTRPAGCFAGKLVVTMRPFRAADAIRAVQITSRFPGVHGAPVHLGDPSLVGIDISKPYPGTRGSTEVLPGEIPLFWACGLTLQLALAKARPPIYITHAPASMLVTDVRNATLAST